MLRRRHARFWLAVGGVVVSAVTLGAACGATATRPDVALTPENATLDVPFDLRASGFRPRQTVTIEFSSRGRHGSRVVLANARGEVVLRDQYLLARMHPVQAVDGRSSVVVRVTVRGGGAVASTSARRSPILFDGSTMQISQKSVPEVGFLATWVRPRGASRHTAVLLLGGSEGGLGYGELDTALVAHGYPVLHLAYFGVAGLPPTLARIPLGYFERALRWLAGRPEVDPARIVTLGVSRGGELALILASTFPRLVHAAVAYTPSYEAVGSPLSPAVPAWTYRGKPVLGAIPVERSSGPLFVVGGSDDRLWPSGLSVRRIARRMHLHGRADIVALDYRAAGHLLGTVLPAQVTVNAKGYGHVDSPYGAVELGGTPAADEQAREDAWPRLLRFLARSHG